jgi:tRNA modification GTPase
MYGRVDLTQAEGVRDTVEALTDAQLRQANLLRSGRLHDEIQEVREEVVGVLASVEASTDFSEEVGNLDRDSAKGRCKAVVANIDRLIGQAEGGQLLRKGLTIAIVGLPNAGKSSILNALLGADRAIVTEYPGTTRDTVEELADLGGVPCRLIDTAGLRSTAEPIEKIGVERARHAAENADIVWYVYDIKKGWTKDDDAQFAKIERPTTILANKCDLKATADKGLAVSAVTGAGLPALIRSVAGKAVAPDAPLPLVNARHLPLLEQAKVALLDVIASLESPVPDDLAAVGLQQAARVLGEVTGETASADVVERIFWDFCLGK